MLKKLTSVLLTAALLLSMLGTFAFAGSSDSFTAYSFNSEKVKNAVAVAAAKLIGEDGTAEVSEALEKAVIEKAGNFKTTRAIKKAMKGYAVLNVSELPESAQKIAEEAQYTISKDNVVYIVVELDNHPELRNLLTLCQASKALFEKQNAFVAESGIENLTVNTYRHIIGELVLHLAVYELTKAAGGASKESPLNSYYESARECELNQNESRGALLIYIIGSLVYSRFGQ